MENFDLTPAESQILDFIVLREDGSSTNNICNYIESGISTTSQYKTSKTDCSRDRGEIDADDTVDYSQKLSTETHYGGLCQKSRKSQNTITKSSNSLENQEFRCQKYIGFGSFGSLGSAGIGAFLSGGSS